MLFLVAGADKEEPLAEVLEGPPIASLYRLTSSGEALRPALVALGDWAHVHLGAAVASR